MKYAVVVSGGKQYKVNEGQEILMDKLAASKDEKFSFPQVLLFKDGDNVIIGTPYVGEVKVVGKMMGDEKGDKITISKFKAKVHYRRKMGFRPLYSRIRIESISLSAPKKETGKKTVKPRSK